MPSFAEALGLHKDFFEDKFKFPTATLRPLRYSEHKSAPEKGVLGAGAHSDYGVLTVLWTDGRNGLEIRKNDVWCPVKPLPDEKNAFICNVGDLCERWTNGVFKSTVHRVVTTADLAGRGNKRHSCAFFWEPDFDTFVEPLPACVAENPPRRYEPTTYGEYILAKYRATHADFEKR
jgi:isopenicillin N synthase-like dioxygenase